MEFIESRVRGAYILRLKRNEDPRGYFARAWCSEEYAQHGLNPNVVQVNVAHNLRKGTVRGLHYQKPPFAEAKTVRCARGAIFDVVVDLRPESPTHRQWFGLELNATEGTMLYVPEGCAHGYQTLVDDSEMSYLTSAAYVPAAATGVRFDDPAFGISWPLPVSLISDADRGWPGYQAG